MSIEAEEVFQVDTGYACAGVVVLHGWVIDAAPIYRWMIGKSWASVKRWKRIIEVRAYLHPQSTMDSVGRHGVPD